MKKLYHLSTCSTCKKIIAELNDGKGFVMQDIKTDQITEEQLDQMKSMSGNYESLFSRKAMKYRAMGLHEQTLSESVYKKLILEEYTFLKRPVVIIDDKIFIGNLSNTIAEAKKHI